MNTLPEILPPRDKTHIQQKTIIPHKDRRSRGTILTLGGAILLGLNGIFVIGTYASSYMLGYMIFLCAIGRLYISRRYTFSTLSYILTKTQIQIMRKGKKMYEFNKNNILSVSSYITLPAYPSRGYIRRSSQIIATLSRRKNIKIELENKTVILSEKILPRLDSQHSE